MLDHKKYNKNDSLWDRYLGMTAAMTQVPVPTAKVGLIVILREWKN